MSPSCQVLAAFIILAVIWRLTIQARSRINEDRLRRRGAVEIGRANSLGLTLADTVIYLAAISEGLARGLALDLSAWVGVALYILGAASHLAFMRALGRLWTRAFIAQEHFEGGAWLLRTTRYPTYMLPTGLELLGLCLAMHAHLVMAVSLPLCSLLLAERMRLEEQAMGERFGAN